MEKSVDSYISKRVLFQKSKRSILVIDDSIDTLYLQRTILEMEDFEVFTALGGKEALDLLSEIEKPDLILLDMQMCKMSGHDFLKVLEEINPEIIETVPVVFLTGMDVVPKSRAVGSICKGQGVNKFLDELHRFIEMKPNDVKH